MKPRALDSLPQVDTDGECLILRRVLLNGRPHDIRVWKYDENGDSVAIGEVLKETIRKTVKLSQEIFPQYVAIGQKITYADRPTEGCFFEDRDVEPDSPVIGLMKEIHRGFFREEKTIWSKNGENPFVSLTHLPKVTPPAVSLPSRVEEPVSPPPSPRAPVADSPAPAAAAAPKKEDFLEGVDYEGLVNYSKDRRDDPKLEKVYQVYQNLLSNPSDREEDEEELFQRLILPAYRHLSDELADREDLMTEEERDLDPAIWAKDMGARVTLERILVNQSIDPLVDELTSY